MTFYRNTSLTNEERKSIILCNSWGRKNNRILYRKEGLTPHYILNKAPSEHYTSGVENTILIVTNPEMEAESFEKSPRFESLCRLLTENLLAEERINFDEFKTSWPEQRYLNLLQKGQIVPNVCRSIS